MENFDIQTIQNLIGETATQAAKNAQLNAQTAMSVAHMSDQLGIVMTKVNTHDDKIISMENRLDVLEYRSEVSGDMIDNIKATASRRVNDILGGNELDKQKYSKIFFSTLYTEAKYVGLHKPIKNTQKGDYQRVIDFIESWIPISGIAALKMKVDIKAQNRREAKEMGYDV